MASSRMHFLGMLDDDSDGGESSMRMVCPPTPGAFRAKHVAFLAHGAGKGQREAMFFNTYVLLVYSKRVAIEGC